MKTRITGIIVVAMMLIMIPAASAGDPFTALGLARFENETRVPEDWIIEMWNLDHPEFEGQPWDYHTYEYLPFPPPAGHNWYNAGEHAGFSDPENCTERIKVDISSPDRTWTGSTTVVFSEAWTGVRLNFNVTVEQQAQQPEIFEMNLSPGWNLISLPLTATDNSVSAVLSTVSQDAVRQYDATTKTFEDATTMDPGTGYFVHVTTAGTWVYEGTPVSSTSPGLEPGLNMIGLPNCTMDVGTAMGSADYWYVSRWNADDQKYEVHNPSAPSSFYGFITMTAGEGYFVSAKSDDSGFEISCSS